MKSLKKRLLFIGAGVALLYLAILGWFVVREDSFVYFPRPGLRSADSVNIGIEVVHLTTSDSVQLVGWIIPAAGNDSSSVWFLYLHGNGGNISSRGYIDHYIDFQQMGINTFAIDYRGYGASGGTPDEQGFYTDARTAFEYLANEQHVPSNNIIIFGYSLGSAVATELATHVDAGGVVLEGAFLSAPDLGQESYPFIPATWIMKNRFDSMIRIQAIDEPKLFLHATADEVVPFAHGKALFAAAHGPKMFVETGGGHNTAHTEDSSVFYGGIAQFLQQVKRSHQ